MILNAGILGDSAWYYHPFTVIILAWIGFLAILVVYRILFHPLAAVPGPWPAKVTGLYRTYLYWRGTFHEDIVNLHKKYGKVVRINTDEVSTVDAVSLKQIYGFGNNNARKHQFYDAFRLDLPDAFNEIDPANHALIRKRSSNAYAMSSIIAYEPYMQSVLDLCWSKIREYLASNDGQPIDMSKWSHHLAFDFISDLVCGQPMGHLSQGKDVGDIRATINRITKLVVLLGDIPTQTAFLRNPVITFIQSRILRIKNPMEGFFQFSADRVRDRVTGRSGVDRKDMLSHFTYAKPTMEPTAENIEREILRDVQTAFGAGSDTTSISMRAIIVYLGLHIDIYKRLQKDIDGFYTANELGALEPLTFNQTKKIPLIRAVVAEAVRLVPAICGQLLRVSPGITVDKYWIPRGYTIGISAMAVNKEPSIFGDDADKFRPDRWLEGSDAYTRLDNASMTFGRGARGCLGKNIALVCVVLPFTLLSIFPSSHILSPPVT
jgi:cytochrome P450